MGTLCTFVQCFCKCKTQLKKPPKISNFKKREEEENGKPLRLFEIR